jgi:hypothetical protein
MELTRVAVAGWPGCVYSLAYTPVLDNGFDFYSSCVGLLLVSLTFKDHCFYISHKSLGCVERGAVLITHACHGRFDYFGSM